MGPKLKKAFWNFMTTFHNFALNIETSWASRLVQPILETRNVNVCVVWNANVCMSVYVKYLFRFSKIKLLLIIKLAEGLDIYNHGQTMDKLFETN